MSAGWETLETHLVNGAFPLQRCVGSTDHSGVFLTQSTPHAPSAAALKLVPSDPASAQAQLARWRDALELSHPHLVRMFEVGECRIDGRDFLFARMEYADQTLAQVLERRALTEEEVREMLGPTLAALEYLHQRNRVHGGLKPSNFLVVGNQLKLASDTVRAMDASDADASVAADVRALGVTLCEALTQRPPSGLEGAGDVELPAGLPASFRGVLSRCVSRDPQVRPGIAELQAWARGEAPALDSPAPPPPSASRLVIRVELPSENEPRPVPAAPVRAAWRVLPSIAGLAVLVALGWLGYRIFSTRSSPSPPVPAVPAAVPRVEPSSAPPSATAVPPADVERPAAPSAAPPDEPVEEVLPDVSRSALDTIRGTIRVSVRVVVARDGSVLATTTEDPGPSRYFERRSVDAARKWMFAPVETDEPRSMLVRFAFTRSGVTASSKPLAAN